MKKKVVWLPYDFDTAIGINNEGALVFGYELEDIDHLEGGADVFNGQESVIWKNVRAAFFNELQAMYQQLRSQGKLSYDVIEKMFEEHQNKWPEAIFNEDAWFKYIDPLISPSAGKQPTAAYLSMLQGSKAEQRKWWLYNRFRYMDSKYNAGDALSDVIQVRGYSKADITVTPYADIYPTVKYGSYLVSTRGKRGTATTLVCPLDTLNDTEIYIYSASQLASVGDLSGLTVGFADFSMATKLQDLKLGDADSNYRNLNLKELYLGNNVLLKTIDIRNCTALGTGDQKSVNISGCTNVEEVYFDNTKITSLVLPNGGVLKKLHLPNTITNLTIQNQTRITELVADVSGVSTLRIENCPTVDTKSMLNVIQENTRVRFVDFRWEAADYNEIKTLCDRLDTMRGLDINGNNLEYAYVQGIIHTYSLTGAQIAEIKQRYPYLTLTADHTSAVLTYKTFDGSSVIGSEDVLDGGNGTLTNSTARAQDAQYTYSPDGWATEPNGNKNADALKNVTADRTVYAAYSKTLRSYTVTWIKASADGGGTLQTKTYTYGTTVNAASAYTGSTPTTSQGSAEDYPFEGWNPASATVQGNTTFTAKFGSPIDVSEISDSWDQIIAAIDAGTYATKYKVGQYKPLDLGTEGTINMQIVAMDADELADGGGTAPLTFIGKETLKTLQKWHTSTSAPDEQMWRGCSLRAHLIDTVLPLIPSTVRGRLLNVTKAYVSTNATFCTDVSRVWIPSLYEITGTALKSGVSDFPKYTKVYSSNADRIKVTLAEGRAYSWWLRDSSSVTKAYRISSTGEEGASNMYGSNFGVCLGFCLGLEQPTITDTWDEILAAEYDGTYKTKYSIGDTVKVDLGTEGSHLFEIVAFDTDDKADGSGKAKITWISKNLLSTGVRHNRESWSVSDIRSFLANTVKGFLPEVVKNSIVTVTKVQSTYDTSAGKIIVNGETTEDDLWIPSRREMYGSSTDESIGAVYTDRFTNNDARVKNPKGDSSTSYSLRSRTSASKYRSVTATGAIGSEPLASTMLICLGFCT